LRKWLYDRNINFSRDAPNDTLVQLALNCIMNPHLITVRDPTGGDNERARSLQLPAPHAFWSRPLPPPSLPAPFSSRYLESPTLTSRHLRELLVPLLLGFYAPKSSEVKRKYGSIPHLQDIFVNLPQLIFAAGEQARPDGGMERLLR